MPPDASVAAAGAVVVAGGRGGGELTVCCGGAVATGIVWVVVLVFCDAGAGAGAGAGVVAGAVVVTAACTGVLGEALAFCCALEPCAGACGRRGAERRGCAVGCEALVVVVDAAGVAVRAAVLAGVECVDEPPHPAVPSAHAATAADISAAGRAARQPTACLFCVRGVDILDTSDSAVRDFFRERQRRPSPADALV
jgi:hypothetical protein